MSFQNAVMNDVERDQRELPFGLLYWRNGAQSARKEGGLSYYGGFAIDIGSIPIAQSENFAVPTGFAEGEIVFDDGTVKSCYLAEQPADGGKPADVKPVKMLLLRSRWTWDDELKQSRSQLLVLLEGANNPVVLCMNGKSKGDMVKAFKSDIGNVLNAANKGRKKADWFMPFCFWTEVVSKAKLNPKDGFVVVKSSVQGKGESTVTPMAAVLPGEITEAYLEAMYVGDEMLSIAKMMYATTHDWQHEWDQPRDGARKPADNGNDTSVRVPMGHPIGGDDVPF